MVTRYEVEAEVNVGRTTCGSLIVTGYLINLAATSGWPTRQPARNTVLPPGSMATQAFERPAGMEFNNASEMFGHCLSLPLKLTAPRAHTLVDPPSNLTSQFSFITGVLIWPFSTFFRTQDSWSWWQFTRCFVFFLPARRMMLSITVKWTRATPIKVCIGKVFCVRAIGRLIDLVAVFCSTKFTEATQDCNVLHQVRPKWWYQPE